MGSIGSIDPDGFVDRGGSGRGIRCCRLRRSRSADPTNTTINLLCPEVGTMAEVEVLQATAPMALSIGYDWLVDGFSLLRGSRKIDFASCRPSKNRVLDGIVIDASAHGMVGMTSLGWQSVTLSTKWLRGRHGLGGW